MPSATISKLLDLPRRQRLEIAERLWLSVADEDNLPVPGSHRRILRQRMADYKSGKTKVISQQELMRRLRTR